MRRLGPGIESRPPADQLTRQRVDFLVHDALILLLPSFAIVAAREDGAVVAAGKEHPARRFEDDRADMLVGQHGFLPNPFGALLQEGINTIDRTDEQLFRRRLAARQRLPSWR